jgi:adenylate cyclase
VNDEARGSAMTILFADLSGFTALTEAHGDADGLAVADRFRDLAAGALCEGARLVKTMGDQVMVVAPTR